MIKTKKSRAVAAQGTSVYNTVQCLNVVHTVKTAVHFKACQNLFLFIYLYSYRAY